MIPLYEALMRLSARQHAAITTAQLDAANVSAAQLRHLREVGVLVRLLDGTYRFTGAPPDELDRLVAVCAAAATARRCRSFSRPSLGATSDAERPSSTRHRASSVEPERRRMAEAISDRAPRPGQRRPSLRRDSTDRPGADGSRPHPQPVRSRSTVGGRSDRRRPPGRRRAPLRGRCAAGHQGPTVGPPVHPCPRQPAAGWRARVPLGVPGGRRPHRSRHLGHATTLARGPELRTSASTHASRRFDGESRSTCYPRHFTEEGGARDRDAISRATRSAGGSAGSRRLALQADFDLAIDRLEQGLRSALPRAVPRERAAR